MEREIFLNLPAEKIVDLVKNKGRPRVGVFVPDGNRRLILATTNLQENTPAFFSELIYRQTSAYLKILEIFFNHGLSVLFLPLFSRSVLSRNCSYSQRVILETIKFICTNDQCLNFYQARKIRVIVYGNISVINNSPLSIATHWIDELQNYTRENTTHTSFIGIGGDPLVGDDVAEAAIHFYQRFHRAPLKEELIEFMYGQSVPQADFFIMSSKFAGLGALPGLICGRDTKAYFLPTPGIMGLNRETYLKILHDLLYGIHDEFPYRLNSEDRKQLKLWYNNHKNSVFGIGQLIGSVSVPCYY